MRIKKILKPLLVIAGFAVLAALLPRRAHADQPLAWDTPYGTIGLPLEATQAILGYDGILKQAIAGAAVPVYTDPKNIIQIQVGAVAPWPNPSGVAVEPYVGIGHNLAKEIPFLVQYPNLGINLFGRYAATEGGRFGAGASISYSFNAPTPAVTPAPAPASN